MGEQYIHTTNHTYIHGSRNGLVYLSQPFASGRHSELHHRDGGLFVQGYRLHTPALHGQPTIREVGAACMYVCMKHVTM